MIDDEYLDRFGHVPLPPYIKRKDTKEDESRYQTVFSSVTGSSAAPTAGLHFTPEILVRLKEKGVDQTFITLHVGLGTFLPVRTENIEDHHMHKEHYEISEEAAEKINSAIREGREILAVGTTSVRTLESAYKDGMVYAGSGYTELYIYPGYKFKAVKSMLTNFHTPGSSLIVMVSAFAEPENIKRAYAEAVREQYRFFSYGEAMLIRCNHAGQ